MEDEKIIPKRAAIYLRVSTDEQVEKFGIDLQKDAVAALVNSKSKLPEGQMIFAGDSYVYIDEGISGTIRVDES